MVFHEVISSSLSSSSNVESSYKVQELPVVEGDSDLDSMSELEDEVDIGTVEIPLWLIPYGVLVTFKGGRVTFERKQGPPWQEVLAQMLEEQEAVVKNN